MQELNSNWTRLPDVGYARSTLFLGTNRKFAPFPTMSPEVTLFIIKLYVKLPKMSQAYNNNYSYHTKTVDINIEKKSLDY